MISVAEKRERIKNTNTVDLDSLPPLMAYIAKVKLQYPDCILFTRVGDFFESYFEDAPIVSDVCDIVLTGKGIGKKEEDISIPMAGIPHTSLNDYVKMLMDKGKKVVVCDQMEDPKKVPKGQLVKRSVTRILTMGTADSGVLSEYLNNFLCSIYKVDNRFGLCFSDITTGEIFVSSAETIDSVLNEIAKFKPSEILANNECRLIFEDLVEKRLKLKVVFSVLDLPFTMDVVYNKISKCFKSYDTSKFKYGHISELYSLYCSLEYIEYTQCLKVDFSNRPKFYNVDNYMSIDIDSRRNLELCENIVDKGKRGTLLSVLDSTSTAMGARLMRQWLETPLLEINKINHRLNAVEELYNNFNVCKDIQDILNGVLDISRIINRLKFNRAVPRDLVSLRESLKCLPKLKNKLSSLCNSDYLKALYSGLNVFDDLVFLLEKSILDVPSTDIRDGLVLKNGYNSELDKARDMITNSTKYLEELEEKEREETGIKNLRVSNSGGMCVIEVTKANLSRVPSHYRIEKVLKNSTKYKTDETERLELELFSAMEHSKNLEIDLYEEIRSEVLKELNSLSILCEVISVIDCLCSFASNSVKYKYVKPQLNTVGKLSIVEGRHPVVERVGKEENFISNNTYLDKGLNKFTLITGPNMAGKSTYMRQVALITLMAHIGCFVPCLSADIPLTDKIFTRIGASDDISSGRSTYMVEMEEVKNILLNATENSLVLLDEVGRGTSTTDGLAIAQAISEYLHNKIGCKTLFATHYHELISLENSLNGLKNYHLSVGRDEENNLVFLRKIEKGGLSESYGIDVAELAGIPDEVIKRAWTILSKIDCNIEIVEKKDNNIDIIEKLKGIDKGALTPISAYKLLSELLEDL